MKLLILVAALTAACAAPQTPQAQKAAPAESTAAEHSAAPAHADLQREVELLKREVLAIRAELAKVAAAEQNPARPSRPSRPRPDASAVYSLPIANNPARGSQTPLVTIVKSFEFACPFCQKSNATMDQLLIDYKGDLRIVYKHFIVHPQSATIPARAACAAGKQGKWHKMSEQIWEKAYQTRDFSSENMERLARKVQLQMGRFRKDRDGVCAQLVVKDQAELVAVGTTGTPSFYINGRFLSGARPIDQFKALVDEEMAKAKEKIRKTKGLDRTNYYEEEILKKGKTSLSTVP